MAVRSSSNQQSLEGSLRMGRNTIFSLSMSAYAGIVISLTLSEELAWKN